MESEIFDKAYGCLMGVAVGDALGMPSSFLTPEEISAQFGAIEGFLAPSPDHIYHAGLAPGQVTDDTEQTLAVARSIIERQRVDAEEIARELLLWVAEKGGFESSALGPSSRRALEMIQEGLPLEEAGRWGDTNGAAMRISPVGIIHAGRTHDIESVVDDVARACLPTHGTDVAISGASAVACGIAACFDRSPPISKVVEVAKRGAVEGRKRGFATIGPSIPRRIDWAIEIAQEGLEASEAAREIYELIGAGVAMSESVPAAIALFALGEGEPRRSILLAANMGGDCDTVASMVGALAGAYSGIDALPPEWIEVIEEVNHLNLKEVAALLVRLAGQSANIE